MGVKISDFNEPKNRTAAVEIKKRLDKNIIEEGDMTVLNLEERVREVLGGVILSSYAYDS